MKFYRTTASVMFFIMCTATMFGMQEETGYIPGDILCLIDEFRAAKGSYEETGHRQIKEEVHDIRMVSRFKDCIALELECADSDDARNWAAEPAFLSLSSMKFIELPVLSDEDRGTPVEVLSRILSGELDKGIVMEKDHEGGRLFFEIEESKVRVFRDTTKDSYICSLKAPKKIKILETSEYGTTIVTYDKGGYIRKWEEQFKKGHKMSDICPGGRIPDKQKIFEEDDIDTE